MTVRPFRRTHLRRERCEGRGHHGGGGQALLALACQAHALIAKGVRLVCIKKVGKSGRTTVVQTQGNGSVKDNIIIVFGSKTSACMESLDLVVFDGCRVEGFVSKPGAGSGRASSDRQYVYVNGPSSCPG